MSGRYAPPQRHQKDIEMQQKLTDVALRALKAPMESRIEISDTERVGLRFRLTSSNKATWLYQKQIKGGARRGFTLGSYPAMSLAQARAEALAIQLEAESIRLDQAVFGVHFRSALTKVFAISISLRMRVTMATLAGFPAARRCSYLALMSGLNRMATNAGI